MLGVALIGFGFATRTFHVPVILSLAELFEIRVVYTSDPAKVKEALSTVTLGVSSPLEFAASAEEAAQHSAVDVVVIASPPATHEVIARAALEDKKHVIVEKPFTTSLEAARELVALAKEKGVLLSVFQNRRWDSDFQTVAKIVKEDLIGDVVEFQATFNRWRPQVRERWRETDELQGGLLYDLGPHLIDQCLLVMGELPESVYADVTKQRTGAVSNDYFHVVLGFSRERRAILEGSMLAMLETPRFQLFGTKGAVKSVGLDPQEDSLKASKLPLANIDQIGVDNKRVELWRMDAAGGLVLQEVPREKGNYLAFYQKFGEAAQKGDLSGNPVDPAQALAVMRVLALADESSKTGSKLAF